MQKIYKIFNPATGEYEPAATLEECTIKLASQAWTFYLQYAHGQPYSVVEINDDGSEVWRTPAGEEMTNPEVMKQLIKQKATNLGG
jgi:hypothetical protein